MRPVAYYNEFDPYAAQWLENLIEAGHIAYGVVDRRSISDVTPGDLRGFTQCHFFAGIGVWSLALRRAGWPDALPVWTGSCPCQPFSASGKSLGFDDERHLWPHFAWLIEQCRPSVTIGEQVASKAADTWIDLVHADLEAMGYAFGAVAFPSAGVGAPHIRDRTYWVAHADNQHEEPPAIAAGLGYLGWGSAASRGLGYTDHPGLEGLAGHDGAAGWQGSQRPAAQAGVLGGLPDTASSGRGEERADAGGQSGRDRAQGLGAGPESGVQPDGVADSHGDGWVEGSLPVRQRQQGQTSAVEPGHGQPSRLAHAECGDAAEPAGEWAGPGAQEGAGAPGQPEGRGSLPDARPAGPTNGLWGAADWLFCRDGKWRPVEPGTFPLADGLTARVGRLRAYGNAVNVEAAAAFISTIDHPRTGRHVRYAN